MTTEKENPEHTENQSIESTALAVLVSFLIALTKSSNNNLSEEHSFWLTV